MVEGTDRAGDFIEACIGRPDEARRMAAADPSVRNMFGAMSGLSPSNRTRLVDRLRERGVTRDGLFASLRLDQHGYESPEQAFGW